MVIKETIRETRIKKLRDVVDFGSDVYYEWFRYPDESKHITGNCVDSRELIGLLIKVIKKKYK